MTMSLAAAGAAPAAARVQADVKMNDKKYWTSPLVSIWQNMLHRNIIEKDNISLKFSDDV